MASKFGEWETVESIGEGGQAQVFKVKNLKDGTVAALKRLKNSKRLGRFKTELEALQKVEHPNVIKLLSFDVDAEKPYLVMELIEGPTLADHLGEQWGTEHVDRLRLFAGIVEGVAAAHNAKVVHRDLKPDNILMKSWNGPAVVSDFGICYIEDGQRQTHTEEAVGPRLYMAPELEDGRLDEVKPASDIYSLGKVLWAILAGKQVFSREQHRADNFNLIKLRNDAKLEHVNRLLDRMIVADPASRFENATVLLERVKKTMHLVNHDYRVASAELRQTCMYCGEGTYQLRADRNTAVRNFGFEVVGNPDWRIYACDQCGHVNIFRLDYAAKKKDWWGQ